MNIGIKKAKAELSKVGQLGGLIVIVGPCGVRRKIIDHLAGESDEFYKIMSGAVKRGNLEGYLQKTDEELDTEKFITELTYSITNRDGKTIARYGIPLDQLKAATYNGKYAIAVCELEGALLLRKIFGSHIVDIVNLNIETELCNAGLHQKFSGDSAKEDVTARLLFNQREVKAIKTLLPPEGPICDENGKPFITRTFHFKKHMYYGDVAKEIFHYFEEKILRNKERQKMRLHQDDQKMKAS